MSPVLLVRAKYKYCCENNRTSPFFSLITFVSQPIGNSICMHHLHLVELNINSIIVKTKNHFSKTIKQKSKLLSSSLCFSPSARSVISRVDREWSQNLRDFTSRHACLEVKSRKFWLHSRSTREITERAEGEKHSELERSFDFCFIVLEKWFFVLTIMELMFNSTKCKWCIQMELPIGWETNVINEKNGDVRLFSQQYLYFARTRRTGLNAVKCHDFYPLMLSQKMSIFFSIS